MKREIIFRSWDGKKMRYNGDESGLYGLKVTNEGVYFYEESSDVFFWHEVEGEFEFMQFTGLKDKNGKDIYESDILSSTLNYRFGNKGEVVYNEDYGCFLVYGKWSKDQHHEPLTCDLSIDCEIIGNIYENPELIS